MKNITKNLAVWKIIRIFAENIEEEQMCRFLLNET